MKVVFIVFLLSSLLFSSVVKNYDWRQKNDSNLTDLGVFGQMYEIEEVSLMDEIEEKAKTVDWKKQIKALKESQKRIMTAHGGLPLCQTTKKRDVFLFNTLKYPIFGPDGTILYDKGFKYNVLSLMSKNNLVDKKPMLFFDLNEVRQIEYAKLIGTSSHLYITDGYLEDAPKNKLKDVYIADSLIKQFKIRCTPSLYVQKKDRYEVFEIDNEYLKILIKNEKSN